MPVSWTTVVAFGLTSLVLVLVPGPSVLFVVGRSLSLGRSGGLLSVAGNTLGMIPHVLAVAAGVGGIVARSAVVFTVVKLVGAAYLVYLGGQAVRHRHQVVVPHAAAPGLSRRRLLAEGFTVGVSNPKTIVFFVAVLPQFVAYDRGSVGLQLLVLGGVFAVIALGCDSGWALAAGTARDWFARTPRRVAHLRAGGGVMMIGLGGILAVTGHPDGPGR